MSEALVKWVIEVHEPDTEPYLLPYTASDVMHGAADALNVALLERRALLHPMAELRVVRVVDREVTAAALPYLMP